MASFTDLVATNPVPPVPAIDLVRIVSVPTYDADSDGRTDTYVRGDKILVDVDFTEPVRVSGGGDVRLRLDLGADDSDPSNSRKTLSSPTVVHGGMTLRFAYTVQTGSGCTGTTPSGDCDADGVWVQTDSSDRVILEPHSRQKVVNAENDVPADLTKSGLPTTGYARTRVDGSKTASDTGPRPRARRWTATR